MFGKLFFWPVQVSYECLQCIQLPKQVFWSPRTITANTRTRAEETVRERDTVSYFNQSSISGRKRSGKGQEVGRSEGKGLLKKTKPVSSPHAMVAHLVYLFFTTSRSLQSCPAASDQPHWRSFHGKNKWLILKQNDKQSGLTWLFECR